MRAPVPVPEPVPETLARVRDPFRLSRSKPDMHFPNWVDYATMSDQPAMQHLMRRRPEYFRRLPTPVSDQAAQDTVYIAQDVFLGAADDMEDIVAAIRKVEGHCLKRGSRECARKAA